MQFFILRIKSVLLPKGVVLCAATFSLFCFQTINVQTVPLLFKDGQKQMACTAG